MLTAAKAVIAAFAHEDFPESLEIKAELLPLVFPAHMIAGGLALVLVPVALALRRRRRWHRLAGRIAAIDVAVAGITAFPVAWVAPVTAWSAAGFIVQGAVWLALLAAGIAFIRRRQVARHRAAMLLMLAATSGAVFFRVWLALFAILGDRHHFELFYACDAWLAWLLPLALTAWWLKKSASPRPDSR